MQQDIYHLQQVLASPYFASSTMLQPRYAQESEIPTMVHIINEAFAVEDFFKTEPRTSVPGLTQFFHDRFPVGGRFVNFYQDEKVVAVIYYELQDEGQYLYFGYLSVDPALQGKGFGSAIVTFTEHVAKACSCQYIRIRVVNLRNDTIPFYKKRNYIEVGTQEWPVEALHLLKMPAHFVVFNKSLA